MFKNKKKEYLLDNSKYIFDYFEDKKIYLKELNQTIFLNQNALMIFLRLMKSKQKIKIMKLLKKIQY